MKNGRVENCWARVGFRALIFIFMIFQTCSASAEIITSDRRVTWQGYVGTTDTIPATGTEVVCSAAVGDGATNDQDHIQTCINNAPAGQVVKFGAGTFVLDDKLRMKTGVVLRGAGMGTTILKGSALAAINNVAELIVFSTVYYWGGGFPGGTAYNITGGLTKGSTSVTTSAAHDWATGDIILIDEIHNPSTDPPADGGIEGNLYAGRPYNDEVTARYVGQINRRVGYGIPGMDVVQQYQVRGRGIIIKMHIARAQGLRMPHYHRLSMSQTTTMHYPHSTQEPH